VLQSSPTIRALFAVPDYRRLWTIGALVGLVRWLEFLALGIFAYQVTQSPSHVALIALVRMLPYVVLGFLVGALADYVDKQRMLAASFFLSGVAFAGMVVLKPAANQAKVVGSDAIHRFLSRSAIVPGNPAPLAKDAILRIICLRK